MISKSVWFGHILSFHPYLLPLITFLSGLLICILDFFSFFQFLKILFPLYTPFSILYLLLQSNSQFRFQLKYPQSTRIIPQDLRFRQILLLLKNSYHVHINSYHISCPSGGKQLHCLMCLPYYPLRSTRINNISVISNYFYSEKITQ